MSGGLHHGCDDGALGRRGRSRARRELIRSAQTRLTLTMGRSTRGWFGRLATMLRCTHARKGDCTRRWTVSDDGARSRTVRRCVLKRRKGTKDGIVFFFWCRSLRGCGRSWSRSGRVGRRGGGRSGGARRGLGGGAERWRALLEGGSRDATTLRRGGGRCNGREAVGRATKVGSGRNSEATTDRLGQLGTGRSSLLTGRKVVGGGGSGQVEVRV